MTEGRLLRIRNGLELHRLGAMLFMLGVGALAAGSSLADAHYGRVALLLVWVPGPLLGLAGSWAMGSWIALVFNLMGLGLLVAGIPEGGVPLCAIGAMGTLAFAQKLAPQVGVDIRGRSPLLLALPLGICLLSGALAIQGHEWLFPVVAASIVFSFLAMSLVYSLALGRLARGIEAELERRFRVL
ncbi:MAG: hypothetical protein AB1758_32380 [Candidatus Eremiobacterota bacterium]